MREPVHKLVFFMEQKQEVIFVPIFYPAPFKKEKASINNLVFFWLLAGSILISLRVKLKPVAEFN